MSHLQLEAHPQRLVSIRRVVMATRWLEQVVAKWRKLVAQKMTTSNFVSTVWF
jgi:hypothetical protein